MILAARAREEHDAHARVACERRVLDPEDADVLNAAMAGRADLLVTSNLIDFIRGPKARTDTEILSYKDGAADVVRLNHPKLPGGLIIASPFQAAGWLLRSKPTPGGVRLTRATLDPSEPNKRALPASRRRMTRRPCRGSAAWIACCH